MTFNRKFIGRTIATMLIIAGIAMAPSILCGFINGENYVAKNMSLVALCGIATGIVVRRGTENYRGNLKVGESYLAVLLCWMTVIIFGMVPYLVSGKGYSFSESFF